MKVPEIDEKIAAHLKAMEKDKRVESLYNAYAYAAGPRVRVVTKSYWPHESMKKSDAREYLEWLEAGNVGDVYAWKREAGKV